MGRADFFAMVLAIGAIAKRRRGKTGAIAGDAWWHVRQGGGLLWLSVDPRQRVDAFVAVENDQGGFMDAFPFQRLHRVRD